MRTPSFTHPSVVWLGSLVTAWSVTVGCAPPPAAAGVPPAPIVFHWPDPAFLPERQCHGAYTVEELQHYLPMARVALQLPSTRAVTVDADRRCLTITVDGIDAGRMVELVLRGLAVPRGAVLIELAEPPRQA
jgi:hypothetical protein